MASRVTNFPKIGPHIASFCRGTRPFPDSAGIQLAEAGLRPDAPAGVRGDGGAVCGSVQVSGARTRLGSFIYNFRLLWRYCRKRTRSYFTLYFTFVQISLDCSS